MATDSTDGKVAVFAQTSLGTLALPSSIPARASLRTRRLDADGRADVAILVGGSSAGICR